MTVPKRRPAARFNQAPQANIQRSSFDLSCNYKTTFDSGWIYPIKVWEILPGDSWRVRANFFARLATPLHPTLDNLHLESFWFFVANRLTWDNWQRFMGERDNPDSSTDYTIPQITCPPGGWTEGGAFDYYGLPTEIEGCDVSALPHRGYKLCWNEFFRDQNFFDTVNTPTDDGPDSGPLFGLLPRGKRRDYFTSCLPWPQVGPGVDLPLAGSAPVKGIGMTASNISYTETGSFRETGGTQSESYGSGKNNADTQLVVLEDDNNLGFPGIYADLTDSSAATINDLRQAFQIQRLQERDARGGTRYTEILHAHFGVLSPDQRLQRPEILSTGYTSVQMAAVPQTSSSDTTTPQGNLSAYGTAMGSGHGFTKSFVEHGYLFCLISVRADLTYQQGIDRMWSRQTKYDFFWPALAHLGEQAVLSKELFFNNEPADNDVFGYQERWAEYKTGINRVTNKMKSSATGTLDPWHYAQEFTTRPTLGASFIEDKPPIRRTLAVQDEPEFLLDAHFDIKAARPMPTYSVPGYIDHF